MTTLYGELTADGGHLVLVAGGHTADLEHVLKRLKTLTPKWSRTDPPGGLTAPLSWPLVVQLAADFGPDFVQGPKLSTWIGDELARRNAPKVTRYRPPTGLHPYSWQSEGAALISSVGAALITDEPGCLAGDTEISINRNGKGFRLSLRDLVARFNGSAPRARWDLSTPTYVQREVDGVVRLGRIVNAWSSGIKTTYTVTTATGRTVRATDEHPFLTSRGWLRLDELKAGDLVHVRGGRSAAGRSSKQRYREIAGLYAHPHARGKGRRTSRYRVAEHRLVAEAALNNTDLSTHVGQIRAGAVDDLTFIDPAVYAVHHVNLDPSDNRLENLQVLTHSDHHRLHAELGKARNVQLHIELDAVVSVEQFGEEETFDIEVADAPHNFIANEFVVHNTGKTVTAILGVVERGSMGDFYDPEADGASGPVLVVCPASVVDPWVDAWRAWAPHLRTVAWRGAGKVRHQLAGTADVYVTSYDIARMDAADARGALVKLHAGHLVIDECHLIKSPQAQRSLAVRRLARKLPANGAVVALSGTPITHHPGDLWPTLVALSQHAWPSRERWVRRYCNSAPGDYKDEILGLVREPEFRLALHGQHRRIAKADALELPPKVYSTRVIDMPAEWRKVYASMESQMLAELPDGSELSTMSMLTKIARLCQLSSAPADVETTHELNADKEIVERVKVTLRAPSWKIDALLEILDERPGEPVVAFAPSRQLMLLAGQTAEKRGLRVGYVVGGQSQKIRTETIAAFQAGELDLICVTTAAGGVGITLTAARTCVFLQRPWSFAEATQAEDRLHRIGSERHESIEVIDVVARNTIDGRIKAVLHERAEALAEVVQDPRIVSELFGGDPQSARGGQRPRHPIEGRPTTGHAFGPEAVPASPGTSTTTEERQAS